MGSLCNKCKGDGSCPVCFGNGRILEKICPHCSGRGCSQCRASGKIFLNERCTDCGGSGSCSNCNGQGLID